MKPREGGEREEEKYSKILYPASDALGDALPQSSQQPVFTEKETQRGPALLKVTRLETSDVNLVCQQIQCSGSYGQPFGQPHISRGLDLPRPTHL